MDARQLHDADLGWVTAANSTKRSGRSIALRDQLASYSFLLPWLLGFFALTLGPALSSLFTSPFTDYALVENPRWIGIGNYARIASDDPRFWKAMTVTFTFVVISVPLKLAFALAVAVALNKGLKGLTVFRAIFYLPSLLGASVAIAVLWRQIFAGDGSAQSSRWPACSALRDRVGYQRLRPPFTRSSCLRSGSSDLPMIIFLAGLRQIPQDMYEAASIDGAGRTSTVRQDHASAAHAGHLLQRRHPDN